MSPKENYRLVFIIELIIYLFIYFISDYIYHLIKIKKSNSWIQVNCIILKEYYEKGDKRAWLKCIYKPRIYYSYTIEGVEYISDRYSYRKLWFKSQKEVSRLLQAYEVGNHYSCFFITLIIRTKQCL